MTMIDMPRLNRLLRTRPQTKLALGIFPILFAVLLGCGGGSELKTLDDYVAMGDQAMRDGKLAEAEKDYRQGVELASTEPRGHLALGNLYGLEQKPALAQQEYLRVLELDPKNARAHAALAKLYTGQSQWPMAEEQYWAAVALDPAKTTSHLDLARVLMRQNKPGEAEREFRTAIGLDPKNAQAHFNLANLLVSESGRQEEAQAEYALARELDPSLTVPLPPAPPVTAPAAPPAAAPATVASTRARHKLKRLNKTFLLTKDAPVYQAADTKSRVVARVHKNKLVRVTGMTGNLFQVKLRTGAVGFIPVSAAE